METQDMLYVHFQTAPSDRFYVTSEDSIYSQLVRSLPQSIYAGRKRKLSFDFCHYPLKKVALPSVPQVKKPVLLEDRINALPDEILTEIFRFISAPADRYACASVCMRWLMLQSHVSPKNIKLAEAPKEVGDELKRSLEGRRATNVRLAAAALGTQGRGGLGKLILKGGPKQDFSKAVSDTGFSSVGACCGALKSLTVWDCPAVTDAGFEFIGKGCSQLSVLNVLNCPGFGDAALQAIAKGCPSLSTLIIERCDNVGDEGIKVVAQHCPELSVLSVSGCKKVGDSGIAAVVSNCLQLSTLKLAKLAVTDAALALVGNRAKELQSLRLVQLSGVTKQGFLSLGESSSMDKLKSLHVDSCPGFSSSFLEALAGRSKLVRLLSLVNCAAVSEDELVSFMNQSEFLECVTLDKCGLVASVFPADTANRCPSLKSLKIRHCGSAGGDVLTRVVAAAAAAATSSLEELDLTGSLSSLSDEDIAGLFASCKLNSLAKLNLTGCYRLTNKGLAAAVSVAAESVTLLALDGCVGITDEGLRFIAGKCTSLQDLDVSRCSVTEKGLLAVVAARGPFLKNLSLAGCAQVTDGFLHHVERSCGTLEALNVKNCKGLSRSRLDAFESHLWSCLVCS